jgi:CrcB protein
MEWLAVLLGGAVGSAARHWVNVAIAHRWQQPVPYATATVNIVGAALAGLLAGALAGGRLHMSAGVRTFVFVGILGGFTTFSSLMLDTFTIAHGRGDWTAAVANLMGQSAVGFAVIAATYYAALGGR